MNKLGVYFRKEKLEALLRGDISNAVVNRYFVYAFQGTGTHLCGSLEATPAVVLLQARYGQMAWESLAEIHSTDNHILKAQGLVQFVHTLIIMGFTIGAQLYLSKICKIIDKAKLQFLPAYGRSPAELSEQFREDAAVLSQAIFLDNYFFLTLSGSRLMTARIEKEFRVDLEVGTLRSFSVVGLGINSKLRSSKRTHTCSTYVR